MNANVKNYKEYEFSLIIRGVAQLTRELEDALFEAGCDDATLSIQYGCLYAQFARQSPSLYEAILSAIENVKKACDSSDF